MIENQLLYTVAAPLVVAIVLRFIPKEKTAKKLYKFFFNIGTVISKFLIIRIGKRAAERIEQGVLSTLLELIGVIPTAINDGLLSDNKKRKVKTDEPK